MEATTARINGVFNQSRILRIPFFQRQYVWQEQDWEVFTNDMYSLIDNDTDYFLGALILKEEQISNQERAYGISQKLSVVDGQQRLTTLSIFMKVLYMVSGRQNYEFDCQFKNDDNEHTPILHHNMNDRVAFNEIMNLETPLEEIPRFAGKQVVAAYRYFRNELMRRGHLSNLLNAIKSHIRFVEITLHQTDNEKQIFETINSLGVDLTTDELLKNFLYYGPNKEEAYIQNWKPIFDDDDARKFWGTDDAARRQQKGKQESKVIETFILHFVKIQMWKYRDNFQANARKKLVAKNNLFESCKAFVNDYGEDRMTLANEIIEYAKLYRKYFDKNLLDVRIPMAASIKRLACYAMAKESTIIPYLLYILRNVSDYAEQIRMFDYLEKYLLRRIVSMPKSTNKNYTEFFSETLIGNEVNTFAKLKERLMSYDATQNQFMPSDEAIDDNISSISVDSETARLFYYMLETRIGYYIEDRGFNKYCIDAIMPKPGAKNANTWTAHEDEAMESLRKTRSQNIGNYLLMLTDESSAKSIKDAAWSNKVDHLKEWSRDVRTAQWFRTISEWNEDAINEHNKLVADTVKRLLPIND